MFVPSMHQHLINASIQIIPVVTEKHPYLWVDEAIDIIQNSGLPYEVGPFATVIEGTYVEVMDVVHRVNDYLADKGCAEWITNLQLQFRSDRDITSLEKTEKFKNAKIDG